MIIIKTLTTKPLPPADDDCCGGGSCAPCVWDQYYADLDQWHIQHTDTQKEKTIKNSSDV
ncbi:MAG: oxidoreductase-like domain-containing protein [Thalassotalea sp.]|nr:oxidoreductase-like domain-containing protein [Thalassotalea sp.]